MRQLLLRRRGSRRLNWVIIFLAYLTIQIFKISADDDLSINNWESLNEMAAAAAATSSLINNTSTDNSSPFIQQLRMDCIPPAIEQFPRPIIGPYSRRHGGIILHIIIAIYTFMGLAIACDDYFVSSLERICEDLRLSPDVAGATFMAAGSSAPELATVMVAVFFAKDDIGVSGVIGSAVFNITFVIAICAICAGAMVAQINWWPLIRDCIFYSISVLLLLFTMYNGYISWAESLLMLLLYAFYCFILYHNTALEKWAYSQRCLPPTLPAKEKQTRLISTSHSIISTATATMSQTQSSQLIEPVQEYQTYNVDPNTNLNSNIDQGESSTFNQQQHQRQQQQQQHQSGGTTSGGAASSSSSSNGAGGPSTNYYTTSEQYIENPLRRPNNGRICSHISWALLYPIHFLCRLTIPDCRLDKYKSLYAVTFIMSIIWISFYSYVMVWMITIIGTTLRIPDTVMGLTFIAAGVSVPDVLSSIAVLKEGYGDMAVSNAIGSNVFDILICLGLPWFIQTTLIAPGTYVRVMSKGLTYSTLSLLSTVAFLILSVHFNNWKLDKRLGLILMIWYFLFITFASMYELNVFGYFNPPECRSNY